MSQYNRLQDNDFIVNKWSKTEISVGQSSSLQSNLSFLVEKQNVDTEIFSMSCCNHLLLRWSLRLYGFCPSNDNKIHLCLWIYRFIMFLCLCLGFWSLQGIQSDNHGSNYLATIVDFVYPSIYVVSILYFVHSNHFWKACSIRSFVMTKYTRYYITIFLISGIITTFSVGSWQKLIWKTAHVDSQDTIQLIMWSIFYITFLLRLYILFLTAIVFWLIIASSMCNPSIIKNQ